MPVAPSPGEIFDRAVEEGERRLDQSLLELVATSFIAGFTIVFGIVTLGIVHALVEPHFGEVARIVGALGFGIGVVFLVVGRAELFNENFFDPVATAVDNSDSWMLFPLVRLWVFTFLFNLVGGVLFAYVFAIEGVLPAGTPETLRMMAEMIVRRQTLTGFASAIVGGALVSLLSFLLQGVNTIGSRITLAYVVGFLLALGPFDHVIVTALHVVFGFFFGASISYTALLETVAVMIAGNIVGGIGLVTTTHIVQTLGRQE